MNQVILLTTDWAKDYWHESKTAKYPGKVSYTQVPDWSNLAASCPLPGLGIYYRGRKNDYSRIPFVYIKINEMTYDPGTGNPYFRFEPVRVSKTQSDRLRAKLPPTCRGLISTIQIEDLLNVLSDIGEEPPDEWLKLPIAGTSQKPSLAWRDYLGNYFLELEGSNLSDREFEDRIASTLTALGFKVTQKGHKKEGAYADGVAIHEDTGIVYDCKNSQNYAPTEDDIRALKQYTSEEMTLNSGKALNGAFIARDFRTQPRQNIFHLPVEALLYLLFVKLSKGNEFNLNPFKLLLKKGGELSRRKIDEYW